ncbi:hypothetical protein R3P38DRAFT_2940459 [Favolaschia claudopus]|uniref:F-box domain-containing protein n=1 Tax=Favolaschia claudopus TaxID=2862362 RepID=A0AAW0BMG1_9AGAR
MDPILPPELEREIFELAARQDQSIALTLLTVCHRVHSWVEPLLYRVLLVSGYLAPALLALKLKPAAFKKTAVRHVFIESYKGEIQAQDLLAELTGIESLVIDGYDTEELLPALDTMHIRKLNLCLPGRGLTVSEWARVTLSRSVFLTVTHLELFYEPDDEEPLSWEDWSTLASLPTLTHLCLSSDLADGIFQPAVKNCQSIQVLIAGFWDSYLRDDAIEFVENLVVKDSRVVVMIIPGPTFKQDWVLGARGGNDFWARAEAFLAGKRRGEIDSSVFLLDK